MSQVEEVELDLDKAAAELKWLQDNPDFEERPATIEEFLGPQYLNIAGKVRLAIVEELKNIVGTEVDPKGMTKFPKAIFTGGIGIGKTTVASIVLPYLAHWVLCLRDPQDYFNLLPGSRIAFMQMSTSGDQAKEVVFGDIKARIEYSKWFQKYPSDPTFKNQIRFPKDIWILPGDSAETTFEGYNILGGILDEADSHKVTKNKDYAEQGYTTISTRVESRFKTQGFVLVIGQMKRANGFAARKYEEFRKSPDAYAAKLALWESFGWQDYLKPDGTRDSFWYDTKRKEIVPDGVVQAGMVQAEGWMEVPNVHKPSFVNNPEKALRDLAGIPPATGSPFISMVDKIESARDLWHERYGPLSPITKPSTYLPVWEETFKAPDRLKRVIHLDFAYSEDGDSFGFAMGHVPEVVKREGELKPFITFDCLVRIHAPAGRQVVLSDVRQMVYHLRDDRGFRIVHATMDGFQSTDTMQQFPRRRIFAEYLSVDRQRNPYEDLREAIYENRIAFPRYEVRYRFDDVELTEIAVKELMELSDEGLKIDHPENGSKDVADSMAGVVYTLMGQRSYHRRSTVAEAMMGPSEQQGPTEEYQDGRTIIHHPAVMSDDPLSAPIPPQGATTDFWNPRSPRRF